MPVSGVGNQSPGESGVLLTVKDLSTTFFTNGGNVPAVRSLSFSIRPGEMLGLVGESGCGKSTAARSLMRLVPPPGRIVSGEVWLQKEDLLRKSPREMEQYRGRRLSMIFQHPQSALNPVLTIGDQVTEVLKIHREMRGRPANEEAGRILESLGITESMSRLRNYPNQLSGGMCQRVMIGMAIACAPMLLIADEPTSALDVTTQAQILDLLRQICVESDTSVLLITHDLGIVAEVCDRVVVMYAGELMEECTVSDLFRNPKHPYTRGLLASIPTVGSRRDRLEVIPGQPPDLLALPRGCKFAPRCPEFEEACGLEPPGIRSVGSDHLARCIKA